jgi:CRISPR-associated protein (TIGR02584 family)
MAKNVLLSLLGLSPSIVTETIDALQKEGHKMGIVVLLSTSDKRITETYIPLLEADFADSQKRD